MLPEKGMHHADVLSRVKRLKTAKDTNSAMKLTESLLNQADRYEAGAGSDIIKELNSSKRGGCNTNLINRSSAQFAGLGDNWERIFGKKDE